MEITKTQIKEWHQEYTDAITIAENSGTEEELRIIKQEYLEFIIAGLVIDEIIAEERDN